MKNKQNVQGKVIFVPENRKTFLAKQMENNLIKRLKHLSTFED